jgi:hypothetical protein
LQATALQAFYSKEKPVRRFGLLLIALILFSIPGSATEQNAKASDVIPSTVPPTEAWNLLEKGRLKIVTRVEDLPENVKVGLAKLFHQQQLEMSDTERRGRVPNNTAPHCSDCVGRTLLFAGLSPNECFVHYRETGLATIFKIVVFGSEEKSGGTAPLWVASGVQAHDLADLRSAIAEHKFYSLPPKQAQ